LIPAGLALASAAFLWIHRADVAATWGGLTGWVFDASRPFGLSESFSQDLSVNLLTTALQVVATTVLVYLIVDRRKNTDLRNTKRWVASRLRDELFEFIVDRRLKKKESSTRRLKELAGRADALIESSSWSVSDRFQDAVEDFHRNPNSKLNQILVRERFAELLELLAVRTNTRRIYIDRIDVAINYSAFK
jgi:hypothetical protein